MSVLRERSFHRAAWLIAMTAVVLAPAIAIAEPDRAAILQVIRQMEAEGARFNPTALQVLGRRGLSAVLDQLLPDTVEPKEPEDAAAARAVVGRLIQKLGHEQIRTRESATEKLLDLGPAVRAAVREAVEHPDAEISWRATRILRKWDEAQHQEDSPLAAALGVYLQRLEDEECLEELVQRTLLALEHGMPSGARQELLWQCLMALARSGKEQYANRLLPLLKHKEVEVGVLVVERFGSLSDKGFFPHLMLEAIQSDRSEIAAAAVKAVPRCPDYPAKAEVNRRLDALFAGGNEPLKFLACYPLMRDFGDPRAVDYLLAQLAGDDEHRKLRAMAWIGDPCNLGRPVTRNLLKTLCPMLKADHDNTRRLAASALAMYSGEEVVLSLLPLLDDPKALIAEEVGYRLRHQPDKALLRRLLTAAAKDHTREKVRQKAAALLEQSDPT